jgi:hypothetical protein
LGEGRLSRDSSLALPLVLGCRVGLTATARLGALAKRGKETTKVTYPRGQSLTISCARCVGVTVVESPEALEAELIASTHDDLESTLPQANAYEALFRTFIPLPWFGGLYLWKFSVDPTAGAACRARND